MILTLLPFLLTDLQRRDEQEISLEAGLFGLLIFPVKHALCNHLLTGVFATLTQTLSKQASSQASKLFNAQSTLRVISG